LCWNRIFDSLPIPALPVVGSAGLASRREAAPLIARVDALCANGGPAIK
jgi:hypothetical protein